VSGCDWTRQGREPVRGQLTGVVAALLGVSLLVILVPVLILARLDGQHRALLAAVERAQALLPEAATLSAGALPTVPMEGGLAVSIYRPDGEVLGVPTALAPDVLDAAQHGRPTVGLDDQVDVVLPAPRPVAGVPSVVRVVMHDAGWERGALRVWLLVIALALALLLAGVLVAELLARRQVGWLRSLGSGAEGYATARLRYDERQSLVLASPDGMVGISKDRFAHFSETRAAVGAIFVRDFFFSKVLRFHNSLRYSRHSYCSASMQTPEQQ